MNDSTPMMAIRSLNGGWLVSISYYGWPLWSAERPTDEVIASFLDIIPVGAAIGEVYTIGHDACRLEAA